MQDGSIGWCSLVALMGLVGACSGDESGQLASEDGIDLTDITLTARSANCADYAENYFSDVMDIKRELAFMGALTISSSGGACTFESNSIPNHDFNDASAMFATDVAEKTARFTVTSSPTAGASPTELSLQYDNAVFLNGVKLDLLAAACYGVGGGRSERRGSGVVIRISHGDMIPCTLEMTLGQTLTMPIRSPMERTIITAIQMPCMQRTQVKPLPLLGSRLTVFRFWALY